MSINCVYMDKNQIILSADSRETFIDESFRDDRQKLFVNEKCKIIWTMTGVLKYNHRLCSSCKFGNEYGRSNH